MIKRQDIARVLLRVVPAVDKALNRISARLAAEIVQDDAIDDSHLNDDPWFSIPGYLEHWLDSLEFQARLAEGREVELEAREFLTRAGYAVWDYADANVAPQIHLPHGSVPAPDFWVSREGEEGLFVEIKKVGRGPGFFYKDRCWSHYVDQDAFQNYSVAARHNRLWIVFKELLTLPYNEFVAPIDEFRQTGDQYAYQRHLVSGVKWMAIDFETANSKKRLNEKGPNGKPVYHFPRAFMVELSPDNFVFPIPERIRNEHLYARCSPRHPFWSEGHK